MIPPGSERLRHEAIFWVSAVRLGLWALPFGRLRRLLGRAVQRHPQAPRQAHPQAHPQEVPDRSSALEIGQAVRSARGFVPRTTCLVEALAAQVMLLRRGLPAELHLGVPSESLQTQLLGHAWVLCQGETVVGGEELLHLPLGQVSLDADR